MPLTVIDTRTRVVSTVGTGDVPMAAAVNDITNRVYVVNYGSSDVTVIDGGSHRPIATVKVGLWPQQIAINTKTNMIYVVNTHANTVSVIDGRTNTVAATVPADKGPWAVAVDEVSNMIFVANRLSDKVTVIDGSTNRAVRNRQHAPAQQPSRVLPSTGRDSAPGIRDCASSLERGGNG